MSSCSKPNWGGADVIGGLGISFGARAFHPMTEPRQAGSGRRLASVCEAADGRVGDLAGIANLDVRTREQCRRCPGPATGNRRHHQGTRDRLRPHRPIAAIASRSETVERLAVA